MSKKNLFNKKFNKLVISITKRIESFFNFFKENFSYKKYFSKRLNAIDRRIFFSVAIIVFIVISYFLTPAFYNKNKIKTELEDRILNQYNLEVKFGQSFKYGLFPKPHFYSKNTIINYNSNEVAISKNTKIFISIKNFLFLDDFEINDLIFKQTDFKIDSLSFDFFINLLRTSKSNQEMKFINSKLFYLDRNDDVIFLTNLKSLNYIYQEDFLQKFNSKLDIFNIPVTFEVEHNIEEKSFLTNVRSYPLRLNIKNYSKYDNKDLVGQLNLIVINQSRKIDYNFKNNNLNFNTNDSEITGEINIKPFFLSSSLNLSQVDLKKLFADNSILLNVLKSEILNNKSLNAKINVNIDKLSGTNFLDNIKFTVLLEEGEIFIKDLRGTFKNSVIININDTQLIVDNNKLKFAGYMSLDFIDVNNFYAHYQINRNYRRNIKKINSGFLLHLDDRFIEIDNLKVNGNINQNLEEFLNKFNSKKDNIFNRIVVRNSIKNFLKNF